MKELILLSKEGNEEAFAALVKKYKTKVFNMAFSMTGNREIADDLAQEVFIKVYFSLFKFKFKSEFGTWLYRITVNHIKDYLRKKGKMSEISIEDVKTSSPLQENEIIIKERKQVEDQRRKLVRKVIQTLPEKFKLILILRDIQGFSYDEIVKILKISPGTVDSRLHRARKLLLKKIAPFLTQKGGNYEM